MPWGEGGFLKRVNLCVSIFSLKRVCIVCCEIGFYSVIINFVTTTGFYFEIREVHANEVPKIYCSHWNFIEKCYGIEQFMSVC